MPDSRNFNRKALKSPCEFYQQIWHRAALVSVQGFRRKPIPVS
jgi:hypothetical protein